MKPKVFVTRPIPETVLAMIASECALESNPADGGLSREDLTERLADCEGVICHLIDRIDDRVMEKAPRLRVIANVAVGYDNIDVASATRRGILVTNTPDVLTDSTADFAMALLLATARRLAEADRFVRAGQWKEWKFDLLLGSDVHHRTLGIIGLGRIGRAMARRARGFAMKILYWMPRRASSEVEKELDAAWVDKEALFREADFISLHLPLTPDTRHLIGRQELRQMKSSAMLINTARGRIVDEEALAEALRDGRIAGAGLDVFEDEPRVNPQLLALPNVVLAPHIGSASRQTRLRMAEMAAENLLAGVSGRTPPNLVNRELAAERPGPDKS